MLWAAVPRGESRLACQPRSGDGPVKRVKPFDLGVRVCWVLFKHGWPHLMYMCNNGLLSTSHGPRTKETGVVSQNHVLRLLVNNAGGTCYSINTMFMN